MGDDNRTLWCGNLSDKVTEELLYELFLQAAPLERVRIPTDKDGRKSNFAFITVKHEISVDYVVQLLNGTSLYDRRINLKPRNTSYNQTIQRDKPQAVDQQNIVSNINNLFFMGQMMQLAYNNCLTSNYNNRQNNAGDRYNRDDVKPYNKHHNRHDNHSSPRQNRNNHQWNNRNYNDRSRKRYY